MTPEETARVQQAVSLRERLAHLADHPAVICHKTEVADLYEEENLPEIDQDFWQLEVSNVPNHAQLMPYLAQLPRDLEYKLLDPEVGSTSDDEVDQWQSALNLGLEVYFHSDDWETYGGCRIVYDAKTSKLGLNIWVNGCEMSSAPNYYIVPMD